MAEAKTVKKRSVGRPKKNKALQQLRVQTWFNAVAEASGKTAYELEKEFAPSTVDRENFNKQRARLWEKYRLGKTMPTIKEKKGGRKGIALLVEEKYPGTLKILIDTIWTLADANHDFTMIDLKEVYILLADDVRQLVIEDGDLSNKRFWRKPCENFQTLINTLATKNSLDSFKALVLLLRESLVSQHKSNYVSVTSTLVSLSKNKKTKPLLQKLSKITYEDFK